MLQVLMGQVSLCAPMTFPLPQHTPGLPGLHTPCRCCCEACRFVVLRWLCVCRLVADFPEDQSREIVKRRSSWSEFATRSSISTLSVSKVSLS